MTETIQTREKTRRFTNPDGTWKPGFIYRVLLDLKPIYIGFTTRTIATRFNEHIQGTMNNSDKLLCQNLRKIQDWENRVSVEEWASFGIEGPGSLEYDCCWETLCNDTDVLWNSVLGTKEWLNRAKTEVAEAKVLGITSRKAYVEHKKKEGITRAAFNQGSEIDADELKVKASDRRTSKLEMKQIEKEAFDQRKARRLALKAKIETSKAKAKLTLATICKNY